MDSLKERFIKECCFEKPDGYLDIKVDSTTVLKFIEKAIIEAKIEVLEERNKSIQNTTDKDNPTTQWERGYSSGLEECINTNEEIIEDLEQLKKQA